MRGIKSISVVSLFSGIVIILSYASSEMCPTDCKCEKNGYARCNSLNRNVTNIPRFPQNTVYLQFIRKRLSCITKRSLQNLTSINITNLDLSDNEIETIAENAFEELHFLETLRLDFNSYLDKNALSRSFASINGPRFSFLSLRRMEWSHIPINMFDSLEHTALDAINLRDNKLSIEHCLYFQKLKHLQDLNLSRNLISTFRCNSSKNLERINLKRNQLLKVPSFENSDKTVSNFIKFLDVSNNRITTLGEHLHGFDFLEEFILNGNPITILQNNTFARLPNLKTLSINRLGNSFWRIESLAFNSSSLIQLRFMKTNFRFSRFTLDAENIFKVCPNLASLSLSFNDLQISNSLFRKMFLPLKNLKALYLNAVSLQRLPTNLFGMLQKLKLLSLSDNNIRGWDVSVFENSSLNVLDLSNNKITLINDTSFPGTLLKSLHTLALYGNEYSCTCDLMWFRNWIDERRRNLTLDRWPDSFICSTPAALSTTLVKLYRPTTYECYPIDLKIVVVICVTVATILIFLVSLVLYKCRWRIRYGIYLIRSQQRKQKKEMIPLLYRYDAFVIYAEENRDWVHDILLPVMEVEERLSLCIHYRDFDIGKLIIDNIDECMSESRKIIVVLSNSFANSEWCQLELRMAQERVLKEGYDTLVIVMLEEVSSRHLTSLTKTLLTTTTYALWATDDSSQELFWKQLKDSVRRPMQHYITS